MANWADEGYADFLTGSLDAEPFDCFSFVVIVLAFVALFAIGWVNS